MNRFVLLLTLLSILYTQSASAQNQQTANDHLKLGIAHFNSGEFVAAINEATRAIELNPGLVDAYRLRFMAQNQMSPEGDYFDDCDMVIKLAPVAPTTEPYYLCRATSLARKSQWESATSDLTKAIEMNPNNAEYYNIRAFTHLGRDDLSQARSDYERSIQLKPTLPSPFFRRGYFRCWEGDLSAAIADFTNAIAWKPDYAEAYAQRAFVWGLKGNIDQVIVDLKHAVSLDPRSVSDFMPDNSFGAPFKLISHFIMAHPENGQAYAVRGAFNLLQKKPADAANDFKKAIALRPQLKSEIDKIISDLSKLRD